MEEGDSILIVRAQAEVGIDHASKMEEYDRYRSHWLKPMSVSTSHRRWKSAVSITLAQAEVSIDLASKIEECDRYRSHWLTPRSESTRDGNLTRPDGSPPRKKMERV
ncbi:hypothetical protein ACP275_13G032400 [Erythranthe tilingii]